MTRFVDAAGNPIQPCANEHDLVAAGVRFSAEAWAGNGRRARPIRASGPVFEAIVDQGEIAFEVEA